LSKQGRSSFFSCNEGLVSFGAMRYVPEFLKQHRTENVL
jgi:hypothetical protein